MFRIAIFTITAIALAAFVGCKPSGGANSQTAAETNKSGASTKSTMEHQGHDAADHDHDHAEGDGHDHDHDHADGAAEEDGHGHGAAKPLGTAKFGGYEVNATQFGDVVAGKEATIEIEVTTLPQGARAADLVVRVWVGTESGAESIKSRAGREGEHNHFHAHVEAPSPLPTGAKWWVEIEATGTQSRGSFNLKK